jgi:hypothetical protein
MVHRLAYLSVLLLFMLDYQPSNLRLTVVPAYVRRMQDATEALEGGKLTMFPRPADIQPGNRPRRGLLNR